MELDDFTQGYFDGRDPDSPIPGPNRSHAYRHSWEVGRREIEGKHMTAFNARKAATVATLKDEGLITS